MSFLVELLGRSYAKELKSRILAGERGKWKVLAGGDF